MSKLRKAIAQGVSNRLKRADDFLKKKAGTFDFEDFSGKYEQLNITGVKNEHFRVVEDSNDVVVVLSSTIMQRPGEWLNAAKEVEAWMTSIRPGWTDHQQNGNRHYFYYM